MKEMAHKDKDRLWKTQMLPGVSWCTTKCEAGNVFAHRPLEQGRHNLLKMGSQYSTGWDVLSTQRDKRLETQRRESSGASDGISWRRINDCSSSQEIDTHSFHSKGTPFQKGQ